MIVTRLNARVIEMEGEAAQARIRIEELEAELEGRDEADTWFMVRVAEVEAALRQAKGDMLWMLGGWGHGHAVTDQALPRFHERLAAIDAVLAAEQVPCRCDPPGSGEEPS